MNIKEIKNLSAAGGSIRSGDALFILLLNAEWADGKKVKGIVAVCEGGEEIDRWAVTVDEFGEIERHSDDFYRAVELFDVLKKEQ